MGARRVRPHALSAQGKLIQSNDIIAGKRELLGTPDFGAGATVHFAEKTDDARVVQ